MSRNPAETDSSRSGSKGPIKKSSLAGSPRRDSLFIGLAGQPNVGKSTIFNLLTGLDQHVGNWPGKTVERKQGKFKSNGVSLEIVDLPGTYSLTSASEEERITRDFILEERPDVVVMVADAAALERNLYLLTELLQLPVPVVLALNMMDVAQSQGVEVEPHVLEAALGLPVIPVVAARNEGVDLLVERTVALARSAHEFDPCRPDSGEGNREIMDRLQSLIQGHVPEPYTEPWISLKLLEGDTEAMEGAKRWFPEEVWGEVHTLLKDHEDAPIEVASGRYEWIGRMIRAAITHPKVGQVGITDRIDRFAVHPFWGLLLLVMTFGLVFWVTYSVAGPVQEWLDVVVVGGLQRSVVYALAWAPSWLSGLVADGILGGAGVVLTFIPILAVFFAALAILEDTGYLARAGYVLDRFMHGLGLHGKSLLPLFLGFGCNVPAVMGSRVIESRRGRLLTILLTPLVPCAARLLVVAFLAPAFFGRGATLVSWALAGMNIFILAAVGILLNVTLFRAERMALIMELPLYHKPNLRTIAMFVRNNIWSFLRSAGTVIVIVAVVIWALSTYPGMTVEESYLARFGKAIEPFGELMGMDWRLLVSLISSFIAKENAIAALGVLFGQGDDTVGLAAAMKASVAPAAALSFLVVTMLFIPCVATVGAIKKETRSWGWTLFSVNLLLVIALGAGILVYQMATKIGWGL